MSFDPNKPQMADKEIEIIDNLIEKTQPKTCLEWGSGGSTNYFPRKHACITRWVSIEHDPDWYKRIKELVSDTVSLKLLDKDDYYSKIYREYHETEFDFILVDGIYRRECMIAAHKFLASAGFMLLHDSGRGEYTPSYGIYPHVEKLCEGEIPRENGITYKHRGLTLFRK